MIAIGTIEPGEKCYHCPRYEPPGYCGVLIRPQPDRFPPLPDARVVKLCLDCAIKAGETASAERRRREAIMEKKA